MLRKFGSHKLFVAVISHKRPFNVEKILNIVGQCTFFVNKGEAGEYRDYGAQVVECGENICEARNTAIKKAGRFPCIQVSDDLRSLKKVSIVDGERVVVPISFSKLVETMHKELLRTRYNFGGVAVTTNRLNYVGKDFSYQNLIVNDLICMMPTGGRILFDVEMALKEDYDMTIRQLIAVGGVVRCNQFLCDFPHRDNKGGANTYRPQKEDEATRKLKMKWGKMIKDHSTREGQVALNYRLIEEARKQFSV